MASWLEVLGIVQFLGSLVISAAIILSVEWQRLPPFRRWNLFYKITMLSVIPIAVAWGFSLQFVIFSFAFNLFKGIRSIGLGLGASH